MKTLLKTLTMPLAFVFAFAMFGAPSAPLADSIMLSSGEIHADDEESKGNRGWRNAGRVAIVVTLAREAIKAMEKAGAWLDSLWDETEVGPMGSLRVAPFDPLDPWGIGDPYPWRVGDNTGGTPSET